MEVSDPIVDVAWLLDHDKDPNVVVVDARPAHAFRAGHIAGARSFDTNALRLPNSNPATIARFQALAADQVRRLGIQPGDRVVFYENGSGCYAARGVWILDYLGIGGSALLDGGLTAWLEVGGEIGQGEQPVEPSDIETRPIPALLTTAGEILDGLAHPEKGMRILDTRSDQEYFAGTIPLSVHVDWADTLDEEGRLRPLAEIRARYAGHGLRSDAGDTIVTFCGSGYRAAHSYVLLKALGFNAVTNYAPSWGEWGTGGLPVERPRR